MTKTFIPITPQSTPCHAARPSTALALTALLLALVLNLSCSDPQPTVTVYAAQDQVYAEPILNAFTSETGIRVRAVYDSEAVKTVGLANRLLAERANPQCDVFWGNEEFRTRQLAHRDLFRPVEGWSAFGSRSRRILLNTNALQGVPAPRTLLELTNAHYRGKISMAFPLFGSTATHFMALRSVWGAPGWEAWCRALAANEPFLEEGNSHVPRRLARGEAAIGLTDSDDIAAAEREDVFHGLTLPLTRFSLLIPNTVAVIRNAPHPEAAETLRQYLTDPQTVERLVDVQALESFGTNAVERAVLQPDWDIMIKDLEDATAFLESVFLR